MKYSISFGGRFSGATSNFLKQMSLTTPNCARTLLHQRAITISSYVRDDGLLDVEGHLTDLSKSSFKKVDGSTHPAIEPIHSMWLRLTVDHSATIVAVQAVTDSAPYGSACGAITPDYDQLVGVRVVRGYRDTIRRLFGRTAGCTHLNELAGAMGTAVLHALGMVPARSTDRGNDSAKPFGIDGCHALKSDGPQVAKFFPNWHRLSE